jgi:TolB-like protein/Flp pilus assembly protein TadD
LSNLFEELKRRNVIRVGVLYAVATWLLLQVTDVLVSILELPPWSGKLIVLFLAVGFPIVLIFSWVYELTPEGIKREKDVDRSASITPDTGRKLNVTIVVLLVIAIAGLVLDRLVPETGPTAPVAATSVPERDDAPGRGASQPAAEPARPVTEEALATSDEADSIDPKSVAVLPFVNMSKDPDNEYFSDGLTEELLNVLARMDGLKVAARTSSFRFKGHVGDMADIGRQLRVATLLEGSVRRAGERVRVTAQLINAEDGYHLWSNTYDREMDDIFAIQDEVAHEVAAALQVALLGGEDEPLVERPTANLEAYEAYLRGNQAMHRRGYEGFSAAEKAYRRAIELDPGFAGAYAALAHVESSRALWGETDFTTGAQRVEPLVDRALALDGDNAAGWAGRALAQLFRHWTDAGPLEAARPSLDRAVELAPWRDEVVRVHSYFLYTEGRAEEAIALTRAALERDPLSPRLLSSLGNGLVSVGRYEEAAPYFQRLDELVERDPTAPYGLGLVARELGRYAEAARLNAEAFRRDPSDHEYLSNIAMVYLDMGDPGGARAFSEAQREIAPDTTLARATVAAIQYYEGNVAAAAGIADEQLVAEPGGRLWSEDGMIRISVDYHVGAGAPETVAAIMEGRAPGVTSAVFEPADVNDFAWRVSALPVVAALHGDDASRDAARALSDWVGVHPEFAADKAWLLAMIHARLGDAESAMRLLEKGGFSRAWMLLRGRDFEPLRGDPVYEAMAEKIEDMALREREALEAGDDRPDPETLLALHRAGGAERT